MFSAFVVRSEYHSGLYVLSEDWRSARLVLKGLRLPRYCRDFSFWFFEHGLEFRSMVIPEIPFEAAAQVFRFDKFALLFVSCRLDYPENERFQFLQMTVAYCDVNAEAIP